jgi:hypothetical protein
MKTPDMVFDNKEIITTQHPEQKEGEIFLGNGTLEDFDHHGWHSKRLGEKAYNTDNVQMGSYNEAGDELDENGAVTSKYDDDPDYIDKSRHYPIFVRKSELEEAGFKIIEK